MPRPGENVRREKIRLKHFEIVDEFDKNGFWKSPLGVIYGFRRTGKSIKVVSLLWETRDKYGTCYRFSPTADNPTEDGSFVYGSIFPKCCCFQAPTFDLLTKIQELQNYFLRVNPPGIEERDKFCFILLDDLSSNKAVINNPKLSEFACNCRNFRITLFLCVQYYNQIKPDIRNNCDFFMTNAERSGTTAAKLKKEVFDMFESEATFKAALKFYTQNYGGLCWVNTGSNGQSLAQSVFWYRCRHTVGDFTLDCPIMELIQEVFGKTQNEIEDELTREIEAKFKEEDSFGNISDLQNGDVKHIKRSAAQAGKKARKPNVDELEDVIKDLDEMDRQAILLQEREEREAAEREARRLAEDDYDEYDEEQPRLKKKKKPSRRKHEDEYEEDNYEYEVKPSKGRSAKKEKKQPEYEEQDDSIAIMHRNKLFEFSRDVEDEEQYEDVD